MARLPRLFITGVAQHIVQRGNNRRVCFASDQDFAAYEYWLNEIDTVNDATPRAIVRAIF